MRATVLILSTAAAVLTAGCSREEEPVANRFERQAAEIQNKAHDIKAQVENEIGAEEARLENQVDTLRNSLGDDNSSESEAEPDANAAR